MEVQENWQQRSMNICMEVLKNSRVAWTLLPQTTPPFKISKTVQYAVSTRRHIQGGLMRCKYEPPWLVQLDHCRSVVLQACRGLPKHHPFSTEGQLGTRAQGELRGPILLASHAACSFPGREMLGRLSCKCLKLTKSNGSRICDELKTNTGRGRVAGVSCVWTSHDQNKWIFQEWYLCLILGRPRLSKDISAVREIVRRHCKPVRALVEKIVCSDDFWMILDDSWWLN